MQRCPEPIEIVVVNGQVRGADIPVGVQQHLEPMAVHTTALVARWHVRQLVRRLKDVAAPDMRVITRIEIDAAVIGTLHARCDNARHIEPRANPARDIFVGRRFDQRVDMRVIQRGDARTKPFGQAADFGAREPTPARGQTGAHVGAVAVAVQPRGAMTRCQAVDLAGRLEACRCHEQDLVAHRAGQFVRPNFLYSGSSTPASANPLARSRQESHSRHGAPSGDGS